MEIGAMDSKKQVSPGTFPWSYQNFLKTFSIIPIVILKLHLMKLKVFPFFFD